jgi:hypothetical protein
MKTFKQLLEKLDNDTRIKDEGLYSSVEPNDETKEKLNKFLSERVGGLKLPDDAHATVMYSTKAIDQNLAKQYSRTEYHAFSKKFEFWAGHDNAGYLVLKLESDHLGQEHERLKSHGCKPTFDQYSPHITIQTPIDKDDAIKKVEIGNNELDNLSPGKLILHNQKIEELRL